MRRAVIVDEAVRMLDKADGVDDQLAFLVVADQFSKPARLRMFGVLAVEIDAAHLLVPLPDDPDLLRRLDEIDGLRHEQQLARNAAGPAAGLGAEGAVAVAHHVIVHAHLRGRPWLEIGVVGIGHPLGAELAVAGAALRVRIGSHRCDLPRDRPEVEAGGWLPAGAGPGPGGHQLGNGALLRFGSRGDPHRQRSDQRRAAQQSQFEHLHIPPLRRRPASRLCAGLVTGNGPYVSQGRAPREFAIALVSLQLLHAGSDRPEDVPGGGLMARGKQSAGLLMYRRRGPAPEVLLVHPGGPFWSRKDEGAWSIPKGLFEAGETPLDAARREFEEETGCRPGGDCLALGDFKQPGGKVISVWACEGDFELALFRSNRSCWNGRRDRGGTRNSRKRTAPDGSFSPRPNESCCEVSARYWRLW